MQANKEVLEKVYNWRLCVVKWVDLTISRRSAHGDRGACTCDVCVQCVRACTACAWEWTLQVRVHIYSITCICAYTWTHTHDHVQIYLHGSRVWGSIIWTHHVDCLGDEIANVLSWHVSRCRRPHLTHLKAHSKMRCAESRASPRRFRSCLSRWTTFLSHPS